MTPDTFAISVEPRASFPDETQYLHAAAVNVWRALAAAGREEIVTVGYQDVCYVSTLAATVHGQEITSMLPGPGYLILYPNMKFCRSGNPFVGKLMAALNAAGVAFQWGTDPVAPPMDDILPPNEWLFPVTVQQMVYRRQHGFRWRDCPDVAPMSAEDAEATALRIANDDTLWPTYQNTMTRLVRVVPPPYSRACGGLNEPDDVYHERTRGELLLMYGPTKHGLFTMSKKLPENAEPALQEDIPPVIVSVPQ